MGKVLKFPGDDFRDRGDKNKGSAEVLAEWYWQQEQEGKIFLVDWRKFLTAQKILSGLRPPSRQRELRIQESAKLTKMDENSLIELFNSSNENDWKQMPSYWVGVYNQINERNLNILTK